MANDTKQNSTTNATPSDSASLSAALRFVLDRFSVSLETMLPARIIAFDRASGRATLQPMIHWLDVNDNALPRHQISDVPVFTFGAGGFLINFPIQPGDLGWIQACDRDITLFKQSLKDATPNSMRTHTFSDAVFFPDVMRKYSIVGGQTNELVIQSTDGSSRIQWGVNHIDIVTPSTVNVITTNVEIDATEVHITGKLVVDGDAEVGGISFLGHGHIQTDNSRTKNGAVQ